MSACYFYASLQAALSSISNVLLSCYILCNIFLPPPSKLLVLKQLRNARKLLPTATCISKVILRLIYFTSIQSIQFIFICKHPKNVIARKNRPYSYRFNQAKQRNYWTILDWTFPRFLLKWCFLRRIASKNNQDVINSQFFI